MYKIHLHENAIYFNIIPQKFNSMPFFTLIKSNHIQRYVQDRAKISYQ